MFNFLPRELLTEIEIMLTTSMLPPVCTLVIEGSCDFSNDEVLVFIHFFVTETIPRGMYVDPDQLRDLGESSGLQTFVGTKVDIEKPEFESESFRVFVFRKLAVQENLRVTAVKLPVHMRYHKPGKISDSKPSSSAAPSAIVKFQNPRLLLACEEDNIVSNCPEKMVTSYCDASGIEKCEFLHIPYEVVILKKCMQPCHVFQIGSFSECQCNRGVGTSWKYRACTLCRWVDHVCSQWKHSVFASHSFPKL